MFKRIDFREDIRDFCLKVLIFARAFALFAERSDSGEPGIGNSGSVPNWLHLSLAIQSKIDFFFLSKGTPLQASFRVIKYPRLLNLGFKKIIIIFNYLLKKSHSFIFKY